MGAVRSSYDVPAVMIMMVLIKITMCPLVMIMMMLIKIMMCLAVMIMITTCLLLTRAPPQKGSDSIAQPSLERSPTYQVLTMMLMLMVMVMMMESNLPENT